MINVIRTSDPRFHDNLFRQLGTLVGIVRQHIRNYLGDIFALIRDLWRVDSPLQPTIIGLVENISDALGSEFKIYLPSLIPQMLRVLSHDSRCIFTFLYISRFCFCRQAANMQFPYFTSFLLLFSTGHSVARILLAALKKFGSALSDHVHLLLPRVVAFFDSSEAPIQVRRGALECVDHLSDSLDFSEYASLLIHPLVRCLDQVSFAREVLTFLDCL